MGQESEKHRDKIIITTWNYYGFKEGERTKALEWKEQSNWLTTNEINYTSTHCSPLQSEERGRSKLTDDLALLPSKTTAADGLRQTVEMIKHTSGKKIENYILIVDSLGSERF